MEPASTETRCGNCDTVVVGPYCHMCGQHMADPLRSVPGFVRDVAGDVLHLESRTARTARDLLVRPGLLTVAYRAGARVRYIQPIQLYLVAAALFFIVNSFSPVVQFDATTTQISSSLGLMGAGGDTMSDEEIAALAARGIPLPLFAERFRARVNSNLPTFLIGSVILFTLAFPMLYRQRGLSVLAHAVFVLHWMAFYLLVMAMDRLLPSAAGVAYDVLHAAVWSTTLLWFVLALKRVYGDSWIVTTGKALLLTLVFNVILALWVVSVVVVASRTI